MRHIDGDKLRELLLDEQIPEWSGLAAIIHKCLVPNEPEPEKPRDFVIERGYHDRSLLLCRTGLCTSRSEAIRKIKEGAVSIDENRINWESTTVFEMGILPVELKLGSKIVRLVPMATDNKEPAPMPQNESVASDQPLPCPFCGSKAQVYSLRNGSGLTVNCTTSDCHITTLGPHAETIEEVVKLWNWRRESQPCDELSKINADPFAKMAEIARLTHERNKAKAAIDEVERFVDENIKYFKDDTVHNFSSRSALKMVRDKIIKLKY